MALLDELEEEIRKHGTANNLTNDITHVDDESTVKVGDIMPDDNPVKNIVRKDFQHAYSLDPETVKYYADKGFTYNLKEDFSRIAYDQQSAFSMIGNAIAQTLVSEIGLGTAIGFSDLADGILQVLGISDPNYSNPVTEFLTEKQEQFRNWASIEQDPDKQDILSGGLTSLGWWCNNIPSVASSLTLLLPSTAVTKGLSYVGSAAKATRFGKTAAKAMNSVSNRARRINAIDRLHDYAAAPSRQAYLNEFLKTGANASLMRVMENYQESRQTYNDVYQKALDTLNDKTDEEVAEIANRYKEELKLTGAQNIDRDSVAKAIAKSSADKTFQMDMANIAFDVVQLYTLRNAFKAINNGVNSASKRRLWMDAKKYAGKTDEEVAKIKEGMSRWDKVKEGLEDRLVGGKLVLAAEGSEGMEEIINYIAQKEGKNLGKMLLEQKATDADFGWVGSIANATIGQLYDPRIRSYYNNGALWDSAFWGVMGGIVFQGLGSQFKKLEHKWDKRHSDANQNVTSLAPWSEGDETSEMEYNKKTVRDIREKYANYVSDIQRMSGDEGVDIYAQADEKGNKPKFETEEEREVAKAKRAEEFAREVGLRALNSGNYDAIREFLADDNVRKSLVEKGVVSEQESRSYQTQLLRVFDDTQKKYDKHMINFNDIAARSSFNIPLEYMQIIAADNVRTETAIENTNKEIAYLEQRVQQLAQDHAQTILDATGETDINSAIEKFKNNVHLGAVIKELGQLHAQRRKLLKKDDSLTKTIALNNIESHIKRLTSALTKAQQVYATANALRFTVDDDGKFSSQDTEEYLEYVDKVITNAAGKTGAIDIDNINFLGQEYLTNAELGEQFKLEQDMNITFEHLDKGYKEAMNDVKSGNHLVDKAILELATTQLSKYYYESEVIDTEKQFIEKVNQYHNTLDQARKQAITEATQSLKNLYKKHKDKLEKVFDDYINHSKTDFSVLGNDAKEFEEALKILDLSKSYNNGLIGGVKALFTILKAEEASKDKDEKEDTSDETGESNPVSQDAISDTENAELNNPSEKQNNGQNEKQRGQNGTATIKVTMRRNELVFTNSKNTNVNPNTNATIQQIDNDQFEITEVGSTIAKYEKLFDGAEQLDAMEPYEVVSRPVIRRINGKKYKLVSKGSIRNVKAEGVEKPAAQVQAEEAAAREEEKAKEQQDNGTATEQEGTPALTEAEDIRAEIEKELKGEKRKEDVAEHPSTGELNGNSPTPAPTETPAPKDNVSEEKETKSEGTQPKDGVINQGEEGKTRIDDSGVLQGDYHSLFDILNVAHGINIARVYIKEGDEAGEKYVNEIIADEIKKGYNKEDVVNIMTTLQRRAKNRADKYKNTSAPNHKAYSNIQEVLFNEDEYIHPDRQTSESFNNLAKAIKQVVQDYFKEYGTISFGGKQIINLENLLRYCNEISENDGTATMLFDALKTYFTEVKDSSILVADKQALNDKIETLEKAAKTEEELVKDLVENTGMHRVDIQSEGKAVYEALDAAQVGDKLTARMKPNTANKVIQLFDSSNRLIGSYPKPTVDASGAYVNDLQGWTCDITNGQGGVSGNFMNALIGEIQNDFANNNPVANAIYGYMAAKYMSDSNARQLMMQTAVNSIVNSSFYKNLSPYFAQEGNDNERIGFLANIYEYVGQTPIRDKVKLNKRIANNIRTFFDEVYKNYKQVDTLFNQISRGKTPQLEVSKITDGELIRVTDKYTPDTPISEIKLPSLQDGLIGFRPGETTPDYSFGVVEQSSTGMVTVAGKGNIPFDAISTNPSRGNTFIVMPVNKKGTIDFVQAYPSPLNDESLKGKDIETIVKEIKTEVKTLLTEYAKIAADLDNKLNSDNDTIDINDEKSRLLSISKQLEDLLTNIYKTKNTNKDYMFDNGNIVFNILTNKYGTSLGFVNNEDNTGIMIPNSPNSNNKLNFSYTTYGEITEVDGKQERNKVTKQEKPYTIKDGQVIPNANILSFINKAIDSSTIMSNFHFVESDNNTYSNLKGFARRGSNGEFIVQVGNNQPHVYSSFNDFVIKNNLYKVNTERNEEGTSNYNHRGVRSQTGNRRLEVKLTDNSSPVEGNATSSEGTGTTNNQGNRVVVTKSFEEQINDILNDDEGNKAERIVVAHFGNKTVPLTTTKGHKENKSVMDILNDLQLLPKNMRYDKAYNLPGNQGAYQSKDKDGKVILDNNGKPVYEYHNAQTNMDTRMVTVGDVWKNILLDPKRREEAIRYLIHEQLHIKLQENQGYINSIAEIYKEFKDYCQANNDENYARYLFEDDDHKTLEERYEEFIIESLCSVPLAKKLNEIKTKGEIEEHGVKNLFQKIMDALRSIFGVTIKDGSLLEKEYYALRNILPSTKVNPEVSKKTQDIINKIVKDGAQIKLTPDEKYYMDKETGELKTRVTKTIEADDKNLDKEGNPIRFEEMVTNPVTNELIPNAYILPSTNIGTGVDEFVRDFFMGKLDNLSHEELEQGYPNVAGHDWAEFRTQLAELRKQLAEGTHPAFKDKHITIVPRDIKAIGSIDVKMDNGTKKLNISGTLDLFGYDEEGKFYVFDLKTVHSNHYISNEHKKEKWSRQLQIYRQFLEEKYGIEVAKVAIIPIKVQYQTPKNAVIKDTLMTNGPEYTVKNPELKTAYGDPNRCQLLENGSEFRGAAPQLQPMVVREPVEISVQYKNLDEASKYLVDNPGVTYEAYSAQQAEKERQELTKKQEEQTSRPEPTISNTETPANNTFGGYRRPTRNLFRKSSIQENDYNNSSNNNTKHSSLSENDIELNSRLNSEEIMAELMPETKAKMVADLASATIKSVCR